MKKSIQEDTPKKDRKFISMLYPDCEEHVSALELIRKNYEHAYILHDKDLEDEETGELKKPHWHIVFKIGDSKSSPRYASAVAKELGLEERWIRQCGNLDSALLYLIHENEDDKYFYPIDEVKGTLKKVLNKLSKGEEESEGDKVKQIIDYINSQDSKIKYQQLAVWVADNDLWDVFRRSALIFCKILDEHNQQVSFEKICDKQVKCTCDADKKKC